MDMNVTVRDVGAAALMVVILTLSQVFRKDLRIGIVPSVTFSIFLFVSVFLISSPVHFYVISAVCALAALISHAFKKTQLRDLSLILLVPSVVYAFL